MRRTNTSWRFQFEKPIAHHLNDPTSLGTQGQVSGRRLARGVARQPLLTGFEKLLRPLVIKALHNPLAPAQLGDRKLAAQAFKDNADLLFWAVLLACRAANLADMLFDRGLRPGF